MYSDFPTRLLETETRSLSPSSGALDTTFKLNRGYRPRIFYEDIE